MRLLSTAAAARTAGGAPDVGEDQPLPETVQAVLAARLDTLPPEHKAILCDAAVLGETFWRGGVAALSGAQLRARSMKPCPSSLARDFVRPRHLVAWRARPSTSSGTRCRATWPTGSSRARRERRSTRPPRDWIEASVGDRGDEFSEIVAHHYATALDLARVSGDAGLAESLVPQAVAALTRAGDRALRLDVRAAERFLTQALELAGDDAEARGPHAALGEAAPLRPPLREADEAYEQAVAGLWPPATSGRPRSPCAGREAPGRAQCARDGTEQRRRPPGGRRAVRGTGRDPRSLRSWPLRSGPRIAVRDRGRRIGL